ncbi:MAG TPA: DEAD/DEAH box helicase [Candidatus Limnocylindrales bacterium]|nr:DEAD/DEAH box helicase [Candidatus Limnocylindrales bacterium]
MRLHQPLPTLDALDRFLTDPAVSAALSARRVLSARGALTAPLPDWLDRRLAGALERRGITALYSHQREAIDVLRNGQDVAIVTPTASGKSLCYNLPVLQAIADDRAARALYLFPTKALSQDQLAELRDLATLAEMDLSAAVYDGDTPAPIRAVVREAGQVVVTNPDMLSTAILPHHTKWFQLFEQLRFIVIDEAHTYRGIFGSHVANVLRRLLRICAHYGSAPRMVCCSATIGNPGELAELLTGRPFRVIDRSGAPQGERHVVVLDPPLLDPRTGVRPGPHGLSYRAALAFLRAGRQTIVFGRARVAVELLLTSLREAMREGRGPIERIRGYRSGYLPSERRAIEAGLRSGQILGVVSTNALELGIDIGRLDVSVLAGYPGTIAATWQQMGRAGRRGEPSVAILVAGAGALDRFVATHPEYLFEATPEEARLDPENVHVLLAHLRAATFELPFDPGEAFGAAAADDLLAFLAEEGHVRQADDRRWYWASENFPASEINLRVAAPENVLIIDTGPQRPRVLGEVDLFAARVLVHEKAIYLHDSRQYHVDELDWEERKALVRPVDTDYYTQAELAVTLKPLEVFDSAPRTAGSRQHGEVMISSIATIFKKLKLDTHENVGWGHIHLPEMELHTTAWWLALDPGALGGWRRDELDAALVGSGRALQTVASVLLMADPHDLGMVAQVQSPHAECPVIYLWEAVPGGVGLSARMFERTDELIGGALDLVSTCDCEVGCPACVGPRGESRLDGRALATRLLKALTGITPAASPATIGQAA